MDDLRVRSHDGRFGLHIDSKSLDYIWTACKMSGQIETGGVLIGRYSPSHDRAVVTRVTGPPADSKRGLGWFFRGIKGLQRRLRQAWLRGSSYYLGEWHLHPEGRAVPSETDIKQMKEISEDESYKCPEPLLLLVGGRSDAWQLRVYVFPRGAQHLELV